jgi:AraC-like DNA-binding protein
MKQGNSVTFSKARRKGSCRTISITPKVPFLTLPEAVQTNSVESFGTLVNTKLRLKSCKPSCHCTTISNTTALIGIHNVSIIATSGCSIDMESEPCEGSLFMIPFATKGTLYVEGRNYTIGMKRNILYTPPLGWEVKLQSPHLAGLIIVIRQKVILDTLAEICGTETLASPLQKIVEQPDSINTSEGCGAAMLNSIYAYFRFIETIRISENSLPTHLRLDDLLTRQLLLLRFPEIHDIAKESSAILSFEQLLEWMKANCCESLSLSELEARCGYSRRSLQRAFQARFGCGPMQWLRKQRMEIARRKLETAPLGTRVQDIALECGYINMPSFCRDYSQAFSVTPRRHLNNLVF